MKNQELLKCEICGKEHWVHKYRINKGQGRFCSYKCMGVWRKNTLFGDKHPCYTGYHVIKKCEVCGVDFKTNKKQIEMGRGRYCSSMCYGRWYSKTFRGENNPSWKNIPDNPCRKFRRNNPEKTLAWTRLNYAKSHGKIIKEPCCVCGDINSEAHHEDYSKQLEVIWFCKKHHLKYHKFKRESRKALTNI